MVTPASHVPQASVVLSVGDSSIAIDPQFGGRLSSWCVGGNELLWQPDLAESNSMPGRNHPFGWGSFVMAPYAGRIRRGEFDFDGAVFSLPLAMPPHAIHGTVYDVAWNVDELFCTASQSICELSVRIGAPWPFSGRLTHRITMLEHSVHQQLVLHADESMPATLGWHPWFTRDVVGASGPLEWSFDRTHVSMMERDADGITTDRLVAVPDGPWDDCFAGVGLVTVRWPHLIEVEVTHDCPVVVLFDGLEHAVCVEPQTGPPNSPELAPDACRVKAGSTLSASMTWTWRSLTPSGA
jgi:aldose 1-epimerase